MIKCKPLERGVCWFILYLIALNDQVKAQKNCLLLKDILTPNVLYITKVGAFFKIL